MSTVLTEFKNAVIINTLRSCQLFYRPSPARFTEHRQCHHGQDA